MRIRRSSAGNSRRCLLLTTDLSSSKQTAIVSGKEIVCWEGFAIWLNILIEIEQRQWLILLDWCDKSNINTQIMRQRDRHKIIQILRWKYVNSTFDTTDHQIQITDGKTIRFFLERGTPCVHERKRNRSFPYLKITFSAHLSMFIELAEQTIATDHIGHSSTIASSTNHIHKEIILSFSENRISATQWNHFQLHFLQRNHVFSSRLDSTYRWRGD